MKGFFYYGQLGFHDDKPTKITEQISVKFCPVLTVRGFFGAKIGSKIGWKIGSPTRFSTPFPTRFEVNTVFDFLQQQVER